MRRLVFSAILLLLPIGVAAPAAAQFEDPMPIEADRVRRGATAQVVDPRSIQVEFSGERLWDSDFTADRLLETLVRVGVSPRVELRGFWAGYNRLEGPTLREGAGDAGVGLKWRFVHQHEEQGGAIIANWRFNSAENGLGTDKGVPMLRAVWTGERGDDLRYDLNLSGVWTVLEQDGGDKTYGSYEVALCLRRPAGYGLSSWLEVYYLVQSSDYGEEGLGGDFGLALTLADTAMLTLAGGYGPWEQYNGWFVRGTLVARAF